MKVLLFRHGERENSGVSNPPLNLRGIRQSEKLLQLIEQSLLPRPNKLITSPKLRAVMTFAKLTDSLSIDLTTLADLDERTTAESAGQFSKRVKASLQKVSQSSGVVYLCTHMDWLEEALILIPSDTDLSAEKYQHWRPGRFLVFEIANEIWHLEKLGDLEV